MCAKTKGAIALGLLAVAGLGFYWMHSASEAEAQAKRTQQETLRLEQAALARPPEVRMGTESLLQHSSDDILCEDAQPEDDLPCDDDAANERPEAVEEEPEFQNMMGYDQEVQDEFLAVLEDTLPEDVQEPADPSDETWKPSGLLGFQSNRVDGVLRLKKGLHVVQLGATSAHFHEKNYNLAVKYQRHLNKRLDFIAGGSHSRDHRKIHYHKSFFGVAYSFPVGLQVAVTRDSVGEFVVGAGSEIRFSPRTHLLWSLNSSGYHQAVLNIRWRNNTYLTVNHDSSYGTGAGITFKM